MYKRIVNIIPWRVYDKVIKAISSKSNTSYSTVFECIKNILSKKVIPLDIKKCEKNKKSKFGGIIFSNFASL